jgi:hypothetical protein
VWTPKGTVIDDFDGNMEEVDAEGRELQKLEGMLSELGDVNRELASGKLGYDDAKAAYTRAAADLLLSERKEAAKMFSAARIHQLESEPQDLAANLVNFYMNVKERGLL